MKIVAHMMCRNEADVIEETVSEVLRWVDMLIVLDGASIDGTYEILQGIADEYNPHGKTIELHSEPDIDERFSNFPRMRLQQLAAPHQPDWILSVDADEIYHYDPKQNVPSPIEAIYAADRVGANVVRAMVPQFWLTFEDLQAGALHENEMISIQTRRRWYSWGHMGTFIWKWNPAHYYPTDVSKRTPELPGLTWRQWQIAGPLLPVCKHYCIRTLQQGLTRAEERRTRGGRMYFGKYFQRWLVRADTAGLHYFDESEVWQMQNNHNAVHAYMAGER